MFGPDLHVFTLKVLALQKLFFNSFRVKKILKNFLIKSKLCNFSVRMLKCFQRIFLKNGPEKDKKRASKVAHNEQLLRPFHFTVQPRIDFSYYEISGSDICSLICACNSLTNSIYEAHSMIGNKNHMNLL